MLHKSSYFSPFCMKNVKNQESRIKNMLSGCMDNGYESRKENDPHHENHHDEIIKLKMITFNEKRKPREHFKPKKMIINFIQNLKNC